MYIRPFWHETLHYMFAFRTSVYGYSGMHPRKFIITLQSSLSVTLKTCLSVDDSCLWPHKHLSKHIFQFLLSHGFSVCKFRHRRRALSFLFKHPHFFFITRPVNHENLGKKIMRTFSPLAKPRAKATNNSPSEIPHVLAS